MTYDAVSQKVILFGGYNGRSYLNGTWTYDGTNWTTFYTTTTGTGGVQTLNVSASGRYIRMYGTQRATQYGYSLFEFQVFGS